MSNTRNLPAETSVLHYKEFRGLHPIPQVTEGHQMVDPTPQKKRFVGSEVVASKGDVGIC